MLWLQLVPCLCSWVSLFDIGFLLSHCSSVVGLPCKIMCLSGVDFVPSRTLMKDVSLKLLLGIFIPNARLRPDGHGFYFIVDKDTTADTCLRWRCVPLDSRASEELFATPRTRRLARRLHIHPASINLCGLSKQHKLQGVRQSCTGGTCTT